MVIFLDGLNLSQVDEYNSKVDGFTCNPTLLVKAGVTDYKQFIRSAVSITDKPFAFEVLSDDFKEMYEQAKLIQSFGKNINVKIPITNTSGESSFLLIKKLIDEDVNVNITAVTTLSQVFEIMPILRKAKQGYLSVFAGRIADTGVNAQEIVSKILYLLDGTNIKVIWASSREAYNVRQAGEIGCDVITLSLDLYKKYVNFGRDLKEVSLDTVKMFFNDGKNFSL